MDSNHFTLLGIGKVQRSIYFIPLNFIKVQNIVGFISDIFFSKYKIVSFYSLRITKVQNIGNFFLYCLVPKYKIVLFSPLFSIG